MGAEAKGGREAKWDFFARAPLLFTERRQGGERERGQREAPPHPRIAVDFRSVFAPPPHPGKLGAQKIKLIFAVKGSAD